MRRHDTDVTSLVFGLIFLGVAGTWALVQTELLSLHDLSLVGPAVLIGAGIVGLVATIAKSTRPRRALADGTTEPPSDELVDDDTDRLS